MNATHFKLVATLDKSGSGTTVLAEEKSSCKLYAIKVLKKDLEPLPVHHLEETVLFTHEHPFIVAFHGLFESTTCIHLVLEHVAGGSLMWHIQQGGFDFPRTQLYAAEICLAVKSFHESGIVHRDLTLENVMVDPDGHIKVGGYELCKENMRRTSVTSTFCGTSCFPAPEVLLDQAYGRAVDWWAVGIILYQMLLRQEPFQRESIDEVYDAILDEEPIFPANIPGDSRTIMQQLLTKQPLKRLGSSGRDAIDVMEHRFFANLNWDHVHRKKLPVTFKPTLDDPRDLSYFELGTADQSMVIKPCDDW